MKIYELIDSHEKWCKGLNARDAAGNAVNSDSPEACEWCVWGAICKCYPNYVERGQAINKLSAVVGTPYVATCWNDLEETTYEDFRTAVEKADI